MKRSRGGLPLLAAGLLALTAVAGCGQARPVPGGPGGSAHPVLVIASFFPLTLEGRHFRPGAKVVLRAQPQEAGLKPIYARAVVGPDGTFTVHMRGYGLDPCTGVTVTATSPGPARASASSRPRGCPPVPVPRT